VILHEYKKSGARFAISNILAIHATETRESQAIEDTAFTQKVLNKTR